MERFTSLMIRGGNSRIRNALEDLCKIGRQVDSVQAARTDQRVHRRHCRCRSASNFCARGRPPATRVQHSRRHKTPAPAAGSARTEPLWTSLIFVTGPPASAETNARDRSATVGPRSPDPLSLLRRLAPKTHAVPPFRLQGCAVNRLKLSALPRNERRPERQLFGKRPHRAFKSAKRQPKHSTAQYLPNNRYRLPIFPKPFRLRIEPGEMGELIGEPP